MWQGASWLQQEGIAGNSGSGAKDLPSLVAAPMKEEEQYFSKIKQIWPVSGEDILVDGNGEKKRISTGNIIGKIPADFSLL